MIQFICTKWKIAKTSPFYSLLTYLLYVPEVLAIFNSMSTYRIGQDSVDSQYYFLGNNQTMTKRLKVMNICKYFCIGLATPIFLPAVQTLIKDLFETRKKCQILIWKRCWVRAYTQVLYTQKISGLNFPLPELWSNILL